jgi:hypothetical protein
LWIRLLAETGFVGTAAFLSWIVLMLAGAYALARGFSGESKLVGVAGLLCCLAWTLEGFSLDTFALPQTWLVLGLVTAMQWNSRRQSVALAPSKPQSPH